jgi:hypothetical protein
MQQRGLETKIGIIENCNIARVVKSTLTIQLGASGCRSVPGTLLRPPVGSCLWNVLFPVFLPGIIATESRGKGMGRADLLDASTSSDPVL